MASIFTIASLILVGHRKWYGWLVGLSGQVFWIFFIMSSGTWGLAPLVIATSAIQINNLIKWKEYGTMETGFFIFREGQDKTENGVLAHRLTLEEAENFAAFCKITDPESTFTIKRVVVS
jgi:hypothetical protein